MKATTIAAFARMTVEDSRKIFTPEQYPPWVVFSNQQKVNLYLNFLFLMFNFFILMISDFFFFFNFHV